MKKVFLVTALCGLGLAACSQLRVPDDTQLANLLQGERAKAGDDEAMLDQRAIECLRAWSGDAELLKGLPMRFAGEDGKQSCRTTLDTRITDAERNPDKFAFEDITAPKVVRRALELQEARRLASQQSRPAARPAPAIVQRSAQPERGLATPNPNVDLGLAGVRLQEAEALCLQTQQAAAEPGAHSDLKRFAKYCMGSLRKLRTTLETSAQRGRTQEQLEKLADSADNVANVARSVLAAPQE